MTNEKISKEEMFSALKCVRCGTIEDLKPFKYVWRKTTGFKGRGRYSVREVTTWTNEVPVCKTCYKKFKTYKAIRIIILLIIIGLIAFPLWLLLLFNVIPSPSGDLLSNFLNFLIQAYPLIILLIVGGISLRFYRIKSKNNPSHYIDNSYGLVRIKPENSKDWYPYNEWAELVLRERISQNTVDPTVLRKIFTKVISKKSAEFKLKPDTILEKNLEKCPNCGNLTNLAKSQICEVCGYEFK